MDSHEAKVDITLEMCNTHYQDDCLRAWFEVERPTHAVVLDGYWIDQTEVTIAQYHQSVEGGACGAPANRGADTRSAHYGVTAIA
jgi:formylglycine-generating enzyme required for sulfatase activity